MSDTKESLILARRWAMPNRHTFSIRPIKELIDRYIADADVVVDPFHGVSNCFSSQITLSNDLDPSAPTIYHLDALEFMTKALDTARVDLVLFDPPYSPRQVSECYKHFDRTVDMQTTQSSFWGKLKKEIARVLRPGGVAITCGWNSGGVGSSNGMQLVEVLLVPHGGWHNDTLVSVEIRREQQGEGR